MDDERWYRADNDPKSEVWEKLDREQQEENPALVEVVKKFLASGIEFIWLEPYNAPA